MQCSVLLRRRMGSASGHTSPQIRRTSALTTPLTVTLLLVPVLLSIDLDPCRATTSGQPPPYVLPLLPAASPSAQAFRNSTLSSWGGSVLRHGGAYHLYASACLGGCNLPAWQSNSAIVHAVSSSAIGPFRYSSIALPRWHTNPQIARAPDGTLLLFTLGARGVPAQIRCGAGPPAPSAVATCNISDACCGQTPPSSCMQCCGEVVMVHWAPGPDGPWTSVNSSGIFAGTNPTPWVLQNGTVIVGSHDTSGFYVYTAAHWKGPYVRHPGNLFTFEGGVGQWGFEDPFLFYDNRAERWRVLFHQQSFSSNCPDCPELARFGAFPAGGAAQSLTSDLFGSWSSQSHVTPAYTMCAVSAMGPQIFARRERPKLLIGDDGTPEVLYTGVCPIDVTSNGYGWCYTHAQRIAPANGTMPPDFQPPGASFGGELVWASVNTSGNRSAPRYGLGPELIGMSTNDSILAQVTAATGGTISRYPGGTSSDYWDWRTGFVNESNSHVQVAYKKNGSYTVRQTTPAQWHAFASAALIEDTVFDVCQLSCSLNFSLAGLHAHAAAGSAITYVELGNEMYDPGRPDVLAKYPQPADYAHAMLPWIRAIKAEFPRAKVALIGDQFGGASFRDMAWNVDVLGANSSAALLADAATLHIYSAWDWYNHSSAPSAEVIAGKLAAAAKSAVENGEYASRTISGRLGLWITEMGLYGDHAAYADDAEGSWLHGLFLSAMGLLLPATMPNLELVLPYCLLCGSVNRPAALTTDAYGFNIPLHAVGSTPIRRTPVGEAQAQVFLAVKGASRMEPLVFYPDRSLVPTAETRSRSRIGWRVWSDSVAGLVQPRIVLLNQAGAFRLLMHDKVQSVSCRYPRTIEDAVNASLRSEQLGMSHKIHDAVDQSGAVQIPAYSTCVLRLNLS